MTSIILEASKYEKKYKCPYCNHRDTRSKLVFHIEKNHQDMIPKDYSAARVVFNMVNKKEHGSCVICRKDTKWDEDKARYERLCERKVCHDTYVKQAHTNTDIINKLNDPEFQQKMLAGRSISGNYRFEDGGSVSYTGSYEKQLLEFLDKILKVKSYDVDSPGPVIEYEYNGQLHKWITDQRYIPYNLVFDVKDGGDNPNNRNMPEYRAKQEAKENAIRKQGVYNYIRLTNNDFEQLLSIMLELKEQYSDSNASRKPIIKINENSNMAISALAPSNPNNVYLVDYLKKNQFSDEQHNYAICKDYMQDTVTVDNGVLEYMPMDELKEIDDIKVFRCDKDVCFNELLEEAYNDTDFYKLITGKELLDHDQISYDSVFVEIPPYSKNLTVMEESIRASIISNTPALCNETYNNIKIPNFEIKRDKTDDLKYYRDLNGVFVVDESTGFRSKSYRHIDDLDSDIVIIKSMMNNISNT